MDRRDMIGLGLGAGFAAVTLPRRVLADTPVVGDGVLRLELENQVAALQSRMRELRKTTQSSTDNQDDQKKQPSGPGESKQSPSHKDGGSRVDPPQQSGTPNLNDSSDYLETSLSHDCLDRPAHSGGSEKAIRERSTVWIA